MTTALAGVGVVITRPERQSVPLRRLIEGEGGHAFLLPAMEIEPHPEQRATIARYASAAFDLIVFVSANAVRFGIDVLAQRRDLSIAAIGPATARALNQAGHRVSIVPSRGFDSAGLLEHPSIARLHGQRVLLIKGEGGLDVLEQELTRRGAEVAAAEVYVRTIPEASPAKLAALERELSDGRVQIVAATSLELAANVLALVPPRLMASIQSLAWLVPSDRVAAGARARGVCGEIFVADSAEDHDMVRALVRWRSALSFTAQRPAL